MPKNRDITGWQNVEIIECNEPLVSLKSHNFIIKPVYFLQGIAGSTQDCLIRYTIAELLVKARSILSKNYNFLVWDAYRPLQVQQALFDDYKTKLRNQYPTLVENELILETRKFVSLPSRDKKHPSPHNTGGAIDLTLTYNGSPLNMGTNFDHFGIEAAPDYFENTTTKKGLKVRDNRRLLHSLLSSLGFKNYPYEWWHWSYGDQMACVDSNQNAIYGGLFG